MLLSGVECIKMKIGIYSDAHFSTSSSILVGSRGSYSKRLSYLVDSFEWMYEMFKKHEADIIINCGDLTTSDTINAEENSALAKALSFGGSVPEFFLLGNHEIKDNKKKYSSIDLLGGYRHITLIRDISFIDLNGNSLCMIPYFSDKEELMNIQSRLLEIQSPTLVFSHLEYLGEGLLNGNGFLNTDGIDKDLLLENNNIIKIFNGHLHNPLEIKRYCQVGSLIGNGFGDSYEFSKPRIIIYDTSSQSIKSIENPHTVLFYKIRTKTMGDLNNQLQLLPKTQKCIQVVVPLSLRKKVSEFIIGKQKELQIEDFRVKSEAVNNSINSEDTAEIVNSVMDKIDKISDYTNLHDMLKLFTDCSDSLPCSLPVMHYFLEKYFKP